MVPEKQHAWCETEIRAMIAEFNAVADALMMPDSERRAIIGMTEQTWRACRDRSTDGWKMLGAAQLRRLSYVLPLMHRVAANHGLAARAAIARAGGAGARIAH